MRALLICVAILLPQMASALSCRPHSVEAAFIDAKNADESYVIVQGKLSFDVRKLPKVNWEKQNATPPLTQVSAVLQGKSLSSAGFVLPFESDVTLMVACYGPWCAQVPQGTDVLAFVERNAQGYVIGTNPCGGFLFDDPNSVLLTKVKACFANQQCAPLKR